MRDGDPIREGKLPMGELEARVMEVLWTRGGWSTPGEVHDVLAADRPVAYTTVMTILVRLWKKRRLQRQRDGRAFAYRPFQSREQHVAAKMREMLGDGGADHPAILGRFVRRLSTDDRAQLRRLLSKAGAE